MTLEYQECLRLHIGKGLRNALNRHRPARHLPNGHPRCLAVNIPVVRLTLDPHHP